MVEGVTRTRKVYGPTEVLALLATLLFAASLPLRAESLVDPTRPPASIAAPANAEPSGSQPGGYTLSSIRTAGKSRRALINGQWVRPGARVDGARVVTIHETEVVLATETGRETLSLYPDVRMKPVSPPGPSASGHETSSPNR